MNTPTIIGFDPGSTEISLAISRNGPVCPACGEDCFDDWWHDAKLTPSATPLLVELQGRLKCHGCGKFFALTKYHDGEFHCSIKRKVTQSIAERLNKPITAITKGQ